MGKTKPKVRNRIRELRSECGLTQKDLAEAIGVSRQTVNAIEGEKYSPSLEAAFQIAAALGRRLDEVFEYQE
ncbi:MAG: helix-turn-helix transcriptional regulator [Phycisphaerales bacterium JB050]